MEHKNSFTVMPMSQTLDLKAGEVYTGHITISNPANSENIFPYMVEVMPYGVKGNDYKADFVSATKYTSIANWITLSETNGTLSPNETKNIDYTITVPEDAPGGGQYAALVVGRNNIDNQSDGVGIGSIYSIASLIYANIDGEIVHEGAVAENYIPGFITDLPIRTQVMLNNHGNTHESANVYVGVKNVLSGQTVYPKEGESGGLTEEIIPDTTRFMGYEIGDISPVGIYEVTQTIEYLGESYITSQIVIACPIWFMFILFFIIISIIFGVFSLIRKLFKKQHVEYN